MGVLVGVQMRMMGKQLDMYKNILNEHAAFENWLSVCACQHKKMYGD